MAKLEASKRPKVFRLANAQGITVNITNFGGKIMSLYAPNRNGVMADVVLGYETLENYLTGNPYFGALIGRYGNRIAKGKFSVDGNSYQLNINSQGNSLHGGPNGFHNKIWNAKESSVGDDQRLELSLESPDGDEGFPGKLKVQVNYTLTSQNELVIDYSATTSKATVVNLTNHAYFNLAEVGKENILNHELKIFANHFIPVNDNLIPTGAILPVHGTPLDFTEWYKIGQRIDDQYEQLKFAGGYDHTWVLNKEGQSPSLAARVREPNSGRVMEVWTTEPGLQFYSGNFLEGTEQGKAGNRYPIRSGFCLEAQHFPDSPNHPKFPSTLLRPGEIYKQRTIYKFGVD